MKKETKNIEIKEIIYYNINVSCWIRRKGPNV